MLRVALIRPGCTDYDLQGRIRGTLNVPLSDQGIAQVQRAAHEMADLSIDVVYCGPCQPAVQAAEIIAKIHTAKVKKIEKFRNLDVGLWQGKLITEVKQNQPKVYRQWQENPDGICPPEGEMLADARSRVRSALDKITKKYHNSKSVAAIVTPEPIASVIRCELLHHCIGDLWKAEEGNCGSWELIEISPQPALR